MTILTEGKQDVEFLVSEANGLRSRETATVAGGQDLAAGTVVAKPTGAELVAWTGEEFTDGVEDEPVGVLMYNVDSSTGAKVGQPYFARDCVLNLSELTFPAGKQAYGVSLLRDKLGIICR